MKKIFGERQKNEESSTNEVNQLINAKLAEQEKINRKTINVLILGIGGSGKTTVFKQFDKLCNNTYENNKKVLKSGKEDIYRNILVDIYDLSRHNIKLNWCSPNNEYKLSQNIRDICAKIADWPNYFILQDPQHRLTRELALEIDELWNDPAMKSIWNIRNKSHIMDNTNYFFGKILDIIPDKDGQYVPSFKDFLCVRDQTTGIMVKEFRYNDFTFTMTDVGGMRAERRKWGRLFDDKSYMIYVMPLSGYNKVLYEDNSTNRYDEALLLFDKIIQENNWKDKDTIIIFTKYDIFCKQLTQFPFSTFDNSLPKNMVNNSDEIIKYLEKRFTKMFVNANKSNKKREDNIHFFTVCTTDNVMNKSESMKSKLSVFGYLRQYGVKYALYMPMEIMCLCFDFSHDSSVNLPYFKIMDLLMLSHL